jgi:hypothetical protein
MPQCFFLLNLLLSLSVLIIIGLLLFFKLYVKWGLAHSPFQNELRGTLYLQTSIFNPTTAGGGGGSTKLAL